MAPPTPPDTHDGGVCTFCGLSYRGRPNQCGRCGTLLNEAAEDARRLGQEARRDIHTRRAKSDLFFLVGLLLGGPMMAIAGEVRLGLFVVLAGALASVLRRYSNLSALGTVLVGSVGAAIVAAAVIEPPGIEAEDPMATAGGREAFAQALSDPTRDIFVDTRGLDAIAIWFTVPTELSPECGDYPPEQVRLHLKDLGFARVVVVEQNQSGGLCSFAP